MISLYGNTAYTNYNFWDDWICCAFMHYDLWNIDEEGSDLF